MANIRVMLLVAVLALSVLLAQADEASEVQDDLETNHLAKRRFLRYNKRRFLRYNKRADEDDNMCFDANRCTCHPTESKRDVICVCSGSNDE